MSDLASKIGDSHQLFFTAWNQEERQEMSGCHEL